MVGKNERHSNFGDKRPKTTISKETENAPVVVDGINHIQMPDISATHLLQQSEIMHRDGQMSPCPISCTIK